jgi:sulfite reductase alpha subunit-like flavoprotein
MLTNGRGLDRTALVVYGTETGTAQDVAEEAARSLERLYFVADVASLEKVSTTNLSSYTLCLFVVSTTGQGDFPANARPFWTSLLKKKLRSDFLSDVEYALVGLGDSSYPKFNWAARKLDKRLKQLGAHEIVEACEADEQDDEGTDGSFLSWLPAFRSAVLSAYPLSDGRQPISDSVPLPAKWKLQVTDIADGANQELEEASDYLAQQTEQADPVRRIPSSSSFRATLRRNDRVTPVSHWQDVRFLSFTTKERIYYAPGDALAIMPKNFASDVDSLIARMDWTAYADLPLTLAPSRPSQAMSTQIFTSTAWPSTCRDMTLRNLLTNYFDITAIPRRSFFAKIANYTQNISHKDRLLEFTNAEYLDEYYDYATRPRRSILEVLQEFDSVKVPWEEVVNVFPPLRQRQFSLASGGALRRSPDGGTTFELLVAVVKYRTVMKKIREGVCTRYLAALPVGTNLNVDLRTEGRFPSPSELQPRCHLLIGTGTGVAPLRSLIYEKQSVATEDHGTILVFGARSATSDFFFEEEWSAINASGTHDKELHVITAFSRDQKDKIYVQDRLRANAEIIRNALCNKKATVVVCGSSGPMPKAVREALVDVLASPGSEGRQAHLPATREEAEIYLANMEKQKRYLQETW